MEQYPVQGIGDVRVDLFKIGHPVVKNDVQVLLQQPRKRRIAAVFEIVQAHIAFADQEYQHVAQAEKIIAIDVFPVAVIVVEIDPAIMAARTLHKDVIPSDVAVLFAVLVQETDAFDAGREVFKNAGKVFVKVGVVINGQIFDIGGKRRSVNVIENPHQIAFFVFDRNAVHEIGMRVDEFEDAGLLLRAAKTLELDIADPGDKLFIEHQLDDLHLRVAQVDGPFDPVFDLVIQPETSFLGILPHEKRASIEKHHIVVLHPEKVAGIGVDLNRLAIRHTGNPVDDTLADFFAVLSLSVWVLMRAVCLVRESLVGVSTAGLETLC